MKTALILHGTEGCHSDNWFPWLKSQLETIGYRVWVPDLPDADHPDIERYNRHILANSDFTIDENTILIGHSSGAVAILGLLPALPENITVQACYLVGSFKDDLNMDVLAGLFVKPFDFEQIKRRSRLFYFVHSDNDPYCSLDHARYLHARIGGDLIVLPGQKHFSLGTYGEKYRQFPYLFHLIAGDVLTPDIVAEIYQDLENLGAPVWLDGGWGVDALLETVSRSHGDVDIVIQKKHTPILAEYLSRRGYREILRGDTTVYNYMLGDDQARLIDVHVIRMDKSGNGLYGPVKDKKIYPAEALAGMGKITGKPVRCISPAWSVRFHTGYPPREVDRRDVPALCRKFGLDLPPEYRN